MGLKKQIKTLFNYISVESIELLRNNFKLLSPHKKKRFSLKYKKEEYIKNHNVDK